MPGPFADEQLAVFVSQMPSFAAKLSQQQINEIVDFIATLHG